MKYLKTFWIVAASLLLTACETPKEKDHSVAQKVVMDEISEDIKVPIQMWVDIETEPVGLGEKKAEASEEDSGLNRNTILFSPVTVFLSEHNPDVLTHSEIRIELPRGGGKIDLSQYIGDSAGSFFVRFEWPEWSEMTDLRSFYVSGARKRKVDGEIHGVGCNKYLEITSLIARENPKAGLKVNTTRDLHVTALGGHFVFASKKDRQIFLTQVTFFDPEKKSLLCEDAKVQ